MVSNFNAENIHSLECWFICYDWKWHHVTHFTSRVFDAVFWCNIPWSQTKQQKLNGIFFNCAFSQCDFTDWQNIMDDVLFNDNCKW